MPNFNRPVDESRFVASHWNAPHKFDEGLWAFESPNGRDRFEFTGTYQAAKVALGKADVADGAWTLLP